MLLDLREQWLVEDQEKLEEQIQAAVERAVEGAGGTIGSGRSGVRTRHFEGALEENEVIVELQEGVDDLRGNL